MHHNEELTLIFQYWVVQWCTKCNNELISQSGERINFNSQYLKWLQVILPTLHI